MKLRFLLLLLSLVFINSLSAQTSGEEAKVWVPYNDHGVWGFSDTLGNIQIKPRYESVDFFFVRRFGQDQYEYTSLVDTRWGENMIRPDGELMLPKKTQFMRQLSNSTRRGKIFLLKIKDHYGIYDLDEGWLTKARFDSLYPLSYNNWMLLKADEAATFTRFNLKTLRPENTDIVAVSEFWGDLGTVNIATTSDGKRHKLTSEGMVEISEEQLAAYESMDEVMLEEVADEWESDLYSWRGPRPRADELGLDKTMAYKDFSRLPFVKNYSFSKAIIGEKDGQMGMVDENGNVLIPFEYDRVRFADPATEAYLVKDGLIGYKLMFSHHPTIEPRYEKFERAFQLPVSQTWVFALFRVEINGERAYVGENGVEYFNFN